MQERLENAIFNVLYHHNGVSQRLYFDFRISLKFPYRIEKKSPVVICMSSIMRWWDTVGDFFQRASALECLAYTCVI